MARSKRVKRARPGGLVVGRLLMNRRGYGFVSAEEGDIYIGHRDLGGAMHRDIVGVRIDGPRNGRGGSSGAVVKVFERSNELIVGRFERHGSLGIVVPADQRINTDIFIAGRNTLGASNGDIVVARLVAYPTRRHAAQGEIVEVLGRGGDPGLDIEVIIREHGLATTFPDDALEEASRALFDVEGALGSGDRVDLRGMFTITIDPVDARDFDDAISIEWIDGVVRLSVHIADVSHYVTPGSALDREARARATSVYLVDRVLPMLPERLSNEICSLNPGADRLAFSVIMDLDRNGHVVSYHLAQSVIRSDRRFDYESVQRWLTQAEPFPDAESESTLRALARIAKALGARRAARGALDFETVEAKVVLAEDNTTPVEVRVRQRTEATNMIEEAMILANEVVAGHMSRAEAPMIYRIHEEPDADALASLAPILREFDYPVDVGTASPAMFQRIIAHAHDRPEKLLINSLLLGALKRARYVDHRDPHFGLASVAYTHFTSPIRRYPDLVVHRLLKAQLNGGFEDGGFEADPMPTLVSDLGWIAEHCSDMEREAESAEDESTRLKLAQLMSTRIGERFEGTVTGVHSFGLFVQLDNVAEGLVHVSSMHDDRYTLEPGRFMLVGERHGRWYRLGGRVEVVVVSVEVARGRIDFELAENPSSAVHSGRRRGEGARGAERGREVD